jgi:hypothetical protein
LSLAARVFFFACLLMISSTIGSGAAPFNDNYSLAYPLPAGTKFFVGSNANATVQVGEPAFSPTLRAGKTVWYSYRAPIDGLLTLAIFQDSCCNSVEGAAFDVWRGSSMALANRLGVAANEESDSWVGPRKFIRLTVPTRAGQILRIRVGSTQQGNYESVFFGLNLLQAGPRGAVHVFEFKEREWSRQQRTIWTNVSDQFDNRFNFPGTYVYLNSTINSFSASIDSNVPTLQTSLSSGTVAPRVRAKPGLVFGEWSAFGNPNLNFVGLWRYSINVKANSPTASITARFPVDFFRIDNSRASIRVEMLGGSQSVKYGRAAVISADIHNDSNFTATGCYITQLYGAYGGSDPAGVLLWRGGAASAPLGAAFSIPPNGRSSVKGYFKPDALVDGTIGSWLTFGVFCRNAPWVSQYPSPVSLSVVPF